MYNNQTLKLNYGDRTEPVSPYFKKCIVQQVNDNDEHFMNLGHKNLNLFFRNNFH